MRRLKTVLHSCSTIWPLKIFSSVDVKTASTAKQLLTLLKRSQNPIVQKKTHTQPPKFYFEQETHFFLVLSSLGLSSYFLKIEKNFLKKILSVFARDFALSKPYMGRRLMPFPAQLILVCELFNHFGGTANFFEVHNFVNSLKHILVVAETNFCQFLKKSKLPRLAS